MVKGGVRGGIVSAKMGGGKRLVFRRTPPGSLPPRDLTPRVPPYGGGEGEVGKGGGQVES